MGLVKLFRATQDGEAYGLEYELLDNGYSETCAAIALMMWCHRMFLLKGHGRHMDVFERAAYNGFLEQSRSQADARVVASAAVLVASVRLAHFDSVGANSPHSALETQPLTLS
jgi:hypothetical protein